MTSDSAMAIRMKVFCPNTASPREMRGMYSDQNAVTAICPTAMKE